MKIYVVYTYDEDGWFTNRYTSKENAIRARDRFIAELGIDNVDWII